MGRLLRRIASWIRWRQLEADLAEELEHHRAMTQDKFEQSGMPADEAVYASRRALGNVTLAQEDAREMWLWAWLDSLAQDLRFALRGFRKRPGFTIVAVLTMALGIGANTAVFSLLDASVLRVMPIRNPHEVVFLLDILPDGTTTNSFKPETLDRLQASNRSLAGLAAFDQSRFSITVDGDPEMRRGEFATGNYFDVVGIRAAAGRLLAPADDGPGKDPVAVISYRFWASRFNRDPSAVGRSIVVGKTAVSIVGVTPREYQGRELTSGWSDIVLPMSLQRQLGLRDHTTFGAIARLQPGVTIAQAADDLSLIRRQELSETAGVGVSAAPEGTPGARGIRLNSALRGRTPTLGPQRPKDTSQARLIASAIAVVLLVACVNIACLLLARSAARQKEMAVRLAIGASRGRLIRQLLTESLLLAVIGGAAGLVYLEWTAQVLTSVLPVGELPFDPRLDVRALAFTLGISLVTGILFGLVPALTITRVDLNPVIQGNDGRRGRMSKRHGFAKSLVVAQVALSLALLVGAGLIVRSLVRLYSVETGFASTRVLTTWVYPTLLGFDHPREMRLYRDLLETLNATPGIQSASFTRYVFTRGGVNFVAPGLFRSLGIDLIQGRDFSSGDLAGGPRVAIITESLARKHFAGESPIGRQIPEEFERFFRGRAEIVGMVGEVKAGYRQQVAASGIYAPYTQAPPASLGQVILYIRTIGDPADAAATVRQAVKSVEPNLALFDVQTAAAMIDQSVDTERSSAVLLACFGVLALVLASIGLFGTMSHAVAGRTKEFGIRMSLGADRASVFWMILRETLVVVTLGVAIGIPIALAGSRLVAGLLFGIEPTDPLTIVVVVMVMTVVTAVAGYLPARRAARVEPIVALRYE